MRVLTTTCERRLQNLTDASNLWQLKMNSVMLYPVTNVLYSLDSHTWKAALYVSKRKEREENINLGQNI